MATTVTCSLWNVGRAQKRLIQMWLLGCIEYFFWSGGVKAQISTGWRIIIPTSKQLMWSKHRQPINSLVDGKPLDATPTLVPPP
ncbi:hypothetical protein CONLIGDRAFT_300399 [Coniochaeta ligniaria NRRL 30616]|uniref:Uncharacterized protein n=1 Tax=Coniochaeta ligniaria NRRL 30616 TaxID=1408157 RepID=A0A1J7JP49_9PEZI|nr:hypothetical protein CONLIGDRAFT_300399 [Coniochaeta ligniaria NRRL 30616]